MADPKTGEQSGGTQQPGAKSSRGSGSSVAEDGILGERLPGDLERYAPGHKDNLEPGSTYTPTGSRVTYRKVAPASQYERPSWEVHRVEPEQQ